MKSNNGDECLDNFRTSGDEARSVRSRKSCFIVLGTGILSSTSSLIGAMHAETNLGAAAQAAGGTVVVPVRVGTLVVGVVVGVVAVAAAVAVD